MSFCTEHILPHYTCVKYTVTAIKGLLLLRFSVDYMFLPFVTIETFHLSGKQNSAQTDAIWQTDAIFCTSSNNLNYS